MVLALKVEVLTITALSSQPIVLCVVQYSVSDPMETRTGFWLGN